MKWSHNLSTHSLNHNLSAADRDDGKSQNTLREIQRESSVAHVMRNEIVRRFSGRKGVYRKIPGLLEDPVHTRLIPAKWLEFRKEGGSGACRGQRPRKKQVINAPGGQCKACMVKPTLAEFQSLWPTCGRQRKMAETLDQKRE